LALGLGRDVGRDAGGLNRNPAPIMNAVKNTNRNSTDPTVTSSHPSVSPSNSEMSTVKITPLSADCTTI
jgi:hypothetical protein